MEADELVEIEAIKQLKARYCRLLDTKQWEAWRDLFTDDLRVEGTSTKDPGADGFVANVRRVIGEALTIHQAHMPEIELTGPDQAKGIWALHDYVRFAKPIPIVAGGDPVGGFVGYGHYEEEYRRDGGTWRISFLRLTRLRVDPLD
jgi:hypothetical protein